MVVKSFDSGISALLPFDPATHKLQLEWSPGHVHLILWGNHMPAPVAIESFGGRLLHTDEWDALATQSRLIHYRDVPLVFYNSGMRAMPIPQSLFDAERNQAELNLLFGPQPQMATIANAITDHDMVWLAQLPQAAKQWVENHFNQVSFVHVAGSLVQKHEDATAECFGQLLIYDSYAWLLLSRSGKLLYAGSIPILSPDDLAYRVLNTCRQLQVDEPAVHWQLGGMIEKDAPLYEGLSRYLHQLNDWPLQYELTNNVPAHYIAHLFQLAS
jgi:hypothetical protein